MFLKVSMILLQSDNESDEDDGSDIEHILPFCIDNADPVCQMLESLIRKNVISRTGILYKQLRDVLSQRINPLHEYDNDVIEYHNSIAYLGGGRTANFVRGPMAAGCGKKGSSGIDQRNIHMNLGGPSATTRLKHQAGYTTKSGVNHPLSVCHYNLCQNDPSYIIDNAVVSVIPIVLSNDGNQLKAAMEFDERLKRIIGLDFDVDLEYIKKNPIPSPSMLKEHLVVEVVISSLTTLDNKISVPCITEYVPKSGKTGENLTKNFTNIIKTVQCCLACTQGASSDEHVYTYMDTGCSSLCQQCLDQGCICSDCQDIGHESIYPSLRACNKCISVGKKCIRRTVFVLCTDCEEGNKKSFETFIESIKKQTIDPDLRLLIVMPDIPHVGKNLKGSFCNWWLTIGNERGNVSLLRSLRNFSNREEKRMMINFIPKNDDIRHRDRQNPHSVTTITSPPLTKYLSEIGYVCCTMIPERTKFTVNNQAGMCVSPTDICLGEHGYLYVLCDSGDDHATGDVLRARLHSPVDDMTKVKNRVSVKEIHYWDSVVYMCGNGTDITFFETRPGKVVLNPSKKILKKDLLSILKRFNVSNVSEKDKVDYLKSKFKGYLDGVKMEYRQANISLETIRIDQEESKFESICRKTQLYGACSSSSSITSIKINPNGVGLDGELSNICLYRDDWVKVKSMCASERQLFICHNSGIDVIDIESKTSMRSFSVETGIQPEKVALIRNEILISDPQGHRVWSLPIDGSTPPAPFCGSGEMNSLDGKSSNCGLVTPNGLCVEFDNVVYIADPGSNTIRLVTPMQETAMFLSGIGDLFRAFSVHEKHKKYEVLPIAQSKELVRSAHRFLKENETSIRKINENLPKTLNGPQGNVAAKTVRTVEIVHRGLKLLERITSELNFNETNLLSCMTLDVENFHATTHVKCPILSKLQYCRSFGNSLKENLKRLCKWSAFYYTGSKKWYPLPESAISFDKLPIMHPLPPGKMTVDEQDDMRTWAKEFGRGVRQRTNRQETTMAKSGTLPNYVWDGAQNKSVSLHLQTTAGSDEAVRDSVQLNYKILLTYPRDRDE